MSKVKKGPLRWKGSAGERSFNPMKVDPNTYSKRGERTTGILETTRSEESLYSVIRYRVTDLKMIESQCIVNTGQDEVWKDESNQIKSNQIITLEIFRWLLPLVPPLGESALEG